jgi:hypothetical protein
MTNHAGWKACCQNSRTGLLEDCVRTDILEMAEELYEIQCYLGLQGGGKQPAVEGDMAEPVLEVPSTSGHNRAASGSDSREANKTGNDAPSDAETSTSPREVEVRSAASASAPTGAPALAPTVPGQGISPSRTHLPMDCVTLGGKGSSLDGNVHIQFYSCLILSSF